MTLGERVKFIRDRHGWSQNELSRRSGVRQALISELEAGKKLDTTGWVLRRLADALGVTTDYLVGRFCDHPKQGPEAEQCLQCVTPLPVSMVPEGTMGGQQYT